MRKQTMVIVLALTLLCAFAMAYADEAVLIDFSLLKADIKADQANQGKMTENRQTMMDFSGTAGASYTEEQKKQMQTSLAIRNWDIVLASSSRDNLNQSLSMTSEATVLASAKKYAGQTVMGFRIHFPVADFNSWAKILPPFEIPGFAKKADVADDGTYKDKPDNGPDGLTRFEGTLDANTKIKTAYGVVKNVGVVKSIAVTVKGLNYPHGLSVLLKDADGNDQTIFLGYLNFDGWKTIQWDNPAYVQDVRNRELRLYPLYPKSTPMVKFNGFMVSRDGAHEGGDFVCYVKDVKILYDKAVLETSEDIDNEAVWNIVGKKEMERQNIESKRFGSQQVLRYLEKMKQETKTDLTGEQAAEPAKK